jgi:hypothetical protein
MQISNAQYIADLSGGGSNVSVKATIDGQEVTVPLDPNNTHYDEILRQVAAGTLTIQDAD